MVLINRKRGSDQEPMANEKKQQAKTEHMIYTTTLHFHLCRQNENIPDHN
jgi:hypothetical protein